MAAARRRLGGTSLSLVVNKTAFEICILNHFDKYRLPSYELYLKQLSRNAFNINGNRLQGEDLIEVSSQLIYQGDAMRVKTGMWTNNIMLFLFDHQLVYCKKDILKRNTYVYKGRIYLDTSEVIDVPDGKGNECCP